MGFWRKEGQKEGRGWQADKPHAQLRFVFNTHVQQRMSVVVEEEEPAAASGGRRRVALVKGSPEAMKVRAYASVATRSGDGMTGRTLMDKHTHTSTQTNPHQPLFRAETLPAWFEAAYQSLAVEGTRVLALGHKVMEAAGAGAGEEEEEDRGKVERELAFAGLAAFSTQIRADSRRVIRQLTDAGKRVECVGVWVEEARWDEMRFELTAVPVYPYPITHQAWRWQS